MAWSQTTQIPAKHHTQSQLGGRFSDTAKSTPQYIMEAFIMVIDIITICTLEKPSNSHIVYEF